jgi:L-alanine-DL-glutamate epimerase-like enolase superfamily enzyme
MPKITKLSIHYNDLPLRIPFKTALRQTNSIHELLVTIETDTGLFGQGAAVAVTAVTGETLASIENTITQVIWPKLEGKELLNYQHICCLIQTAIEKNFSAKAAVDIAIYNLLTQYYRIPLCQFLGGEARVLITDLTISLNTPNEMIKQSIQAVENGFTILKIKLGSGDEEDIKRVCAVADAVGNKISLRLDANQAWNAENAIKIINTLENKNLNIDLIEQPVKASDLLGLKAVKDNVSIPILADEAVFSAKDAIKILELQAADLLSIKLMKTGGIYPALQLITIAEIYQVECMLSCMLEGQLGIQAAYHLACAKPNVITRIDLDSILLCKEIPNLQDITIKQAKLFIGDV